MSMKEKEMKNMTEYYLQVKYQGQVVYRKESLKPLILDEVKLEAGIIEGRYDTPTQKR